MVSALPGTTGSATRTFRIIQETFGCSLAKSRDEAQDRSWSPTAHQLIEI
ncbi:hypothetical protein MY5147_007333 [Beauveria neobassiana]